MTTQDAAEAQPQEQPQPQANTVVIHETVPADKINIRLLLLSNKRTDVLTTPDTTMEALRTRVFESWPKEWTDERPETPNNLRLLWGGRFLETGKVGDLKLPTGETTIIHCLIKPTAEPSKKDAQKKGESGNKCCLLM